MTDTNTSEYTGPQRVFSGIQPTGNLHLGNYLGALKKFVDLQSVASGLGHLPTVLVDHEPVGEKGSIRRGPGRTQRGQQRELEPSTVLVASF